jgi:hypothetical protein
MNYANTEERKNKERKRGRKKKIEKQRRGKERIKMAHNILWHLDPLLSSDSKQWPLLGNAHKATIGLQDYATRF